MTGHNEKPCKNLPIFLTRSSCLNEISIFKPKFFLGMAKQSSRKTSKDNSKLWINEDDPLDDIALLLMK